MSHSWHSFQNRRVLVIGLGISGQSATQLLLNCGAYVVGMDRKEKLMQTDPSLATLQKKGLQTIHENQDCPIEAFDLVVLSPGIPLTHRYCQAAKAAGIELVGEVELACRLLKQKLLGVTGTNGKTTVTLLISHILNHSGRTARALGNVGVPLTSVLLDPLVKEKSEVLVIELSSFQLETMFSPCLDAGVILNITPDHLDRYASFSEYAKAKIRIQKCLKPHGKLYMEEKSFHEFAFLFGDNLPHTYGYLPHSDFYTDMQNVYVKGNKEYTLPDDYRGTPSLDLENLMAAYALCHQMEISSEQFFNSLKTFRKPSHRIQFVRQIDGVSFYDDSKGTNIDAVSKAVGSLKGGIILIAGGMDKGAPYTPWIACFAGKVKQVCAIGQAAEKIKQALSQQIPVELFDSLDTAVKYAAKMAKSGDNVLLSPGCSSYDMFRDYAHRGEEFQRIVNAL
jgi:UDP-N-acetylmuramoylalanine--D-glutamate ligase